MGGNAGRLPISETVVVVAPKAPAATNARAIPQQNHRAKRSRKTPNDCACSVSGSAVSPLVPGTRRGT
jgi:hypothetical protein